MKLIATATIERGAKANRVKGTRKPLSPGTAYRRFRKDPATHGRDYAMVCVSLPIAQLARIDAACDELRMARSHLLRDAALAYIAAKARK